jgi:hypothetical protein
MARLVIKSAGFGERVIDLKLGVNRLGRSPENDFQVEHPTISAVHCELKVEDDQLVVSDCESTNGTFVAGDPIHEARLSAGQSFSIGDIELYIENTDMTISIPKIVVPVAKAPPVVKNDGSMLCPRHSSAKVTHQCTRCREMMCDACVHQLRRRGGKLLKLCPLCSNKVELIGGDKKKKNALLGFLQKTVKMPFLQHSNSED